MDCNRTYCLLLYDHRGHGASPVPNGPYSVDELGADVVTLLDHLGVESASFCGLSLGGMVGLWLASHHPQRIDRLIVMCALARLQPVSRYSERALAVRAGGLEPLAAGIVSHWFTQAFVERHPDTVDRYSRELAGISAEGYASCCDAIVACDLRGRIQRIDAPTLLIAGADDPIVRRRRGGNLRCVLPRRECRGRVRCRASRQRRATGYRLPPGASSTSANSEGND